MSGECEKTIIRWSGSLDIAQAGRLYDELGAALAAGRPVVLDAVRVERADTSTLQLLCSFFREAQARGVRVEWGETSCALRTAASTLNLDALLALAPGQRAGGT